MPKVELKSVWQGKAAIPEKYIREAVESGEDIVIHCRKEGATMTIPAEHAEKRVIFFSKNTFQDKFGEGLYRLAYYNWKPDADNKLKLF